MGGWRDNQEFVAFRVARGVAFACGLLFFAGMLTRAAEPSAPERPRTGAAGSVRGASGPGRAGIDACAGRAAVGASEAQSPAPAGSAARAFADGYGAYRAGDFAGALAPLEVAAGRCPALGDYALYYLGRSQEKAGRESEAAQSFGRLVADFPQSVLAATAELEVARLELALGEAEEARALALGLVGGGEGLAVVPGARLVYAEAELQLDEPEKAYDELMALRRAYPREETDTRARALAYAILRDHPEVADTNSLAYRQAEAELLLEEGEPKMAFRQAGLALALSPPAGARADLLWVRARALRPEPARQKRALLEYLAVAPRGAAVPRALYDLAHLYWHVDDTANARAGLRRLVAQFPKSSLAPLAMLQVGRTLEDDGRLDEARAQYERLFARYPRSEPAADARFRIGWMLYMGGDYAGAARSFARLRPHAGKASDLDMFFYWQARALEQSGERGRARDIFERLALSVDSNYYPALASARVHLVPTDFPAAGSSDPVAGAPPEVSGPADFHLRRVLALKALDLSALEPAELHALDRRAPRSIEVRNFVLGELVAAEAWYDALLMAQEMAAEGELAPEVAERLRYPRGYWGTVLAAARRAEVDPYLVLALIRQESLFNPRAVSPVDARGLMQLMPVTAGRMAAQGASPSPAPLDLFDPTLNVELGTAYLKQLLVMYRGDRFKAAAAYDGGEDAVARWSAKYPGDDDQWVENIAYHETRDYVKKVIGGLREYELLYGGKRAAVAAFGAEA